MHDFSFITNRYNCEFCKLLGHTCFVVCVVVYSVYLDDNARAKFVFEFVFEFVFVFIVVEYYVISSRERILYNNDNNNTNNVMYCTVLILYLALCFTSFFLLSVCLPVSVVKLEFHVVLRSNNNNNNPFLL